MVNKYLTPLHSVVIQGEVFILLQINHTCLGYHTKLSIRITTAHPWKVSYGALIRENPPPFTGSGVLMTTGYGTHY